MRGGRRALQLGGASDLLHSDVQRMRAAQHGGRACRSPRSGDGRGSYLREGAYIGIEARMIAERWPPIEPSSRLSKVLPSTGRASIKGS